MKRIYKTTLYSLAVMLAIVLVGLLAPRAAHAVVATLVQVANTAANPAITSNINDPGRIPYQSSVQAGATCPSGGFICSWEFGNVPAGHRVVIQHISGTLGFATAASAVLVFLNNGTALPISAFYVPLPSSAPTSIRRFRRISIRARTSRSRSLCSMDLPELCRQSGRAGDPLGL